MKKTVDVNIGGIKFSVEEEGYIKLQNYLDKFSESIENKQESIEVMEDIEVRIAELFQKDIIYLNQVVNIKMVDDVINRLGKFESIDEGNTLLNSSSSENSIKKIYRDCDDKKIAGVCSGLSYYFNIDTTIIRIVFLLILVLYGSGILIYIILWIAVPKASSIAQKLEMRGIPVTIENIRKFTSENRQPNF